MFIKLHPKMSCEGSSTQAQADQLFPCRPSPRVRFLRFRYRILSGRSVFDMHKGIGTSTIASVGSTSRHPHELGFKVARVVHAMTRPDRATDQNAAKRIFLRIAEPGTTDKVLALPERHTA
ncbi:MAG: hypothetical protein ABI564_15290 [Ideonella sp.]